MKETKPGASPAIMATFLCDDSFMASYVRYGLIPISLLGGGFYKRIGSLKDAHKVFDEMPDPDLI